MALVHAFRDGGMFMYVVLFAAIVAMLVSTVAVVMALVAKTRQPALTIGVVGLVAGLFVPAIGGIGYALAMRNIFAAVASVDPSARAAMLAQGISEAMNLLVFGGVCGAIPCLLAIVAVIRAALRPATG